MTHTSRKGIRFIAIIEAAKGSVILLAGFGVLGLIHQDAQQMAEELVGHFHLNPASRFPRIFIDLAGRVNDSNLWLLACAAFAYASIRWIEGIGLWHQRRWAEWLGAVSGAIYIPIEIIELLHGVTLLKLALLALNAFCVLYLLQALRVGRDARNHPSPN